MPLASTCGLGTNGLRSSEPRKYLGAKTLEGNWPDERKAPSFAGQRPEARTTYQVQVADATRQALPYYGATLPTQNPVKSQFENNIDYDNVIFYRTDAKEHDWASMQTTNVFFHGKEHDKPLDRYCATVSIQKGETMGKEPSNIHEYRQRWINDQDAHVRSSRFTSTMNGGMASSTLAKFRVAGEAERFLPAQVKAVEVLRDRLVEAHGADSVLQLAASFTTAQDTALGEGLYDDATGVLRLPGGRPWLGVSDRRGYTKLALRAHLEAVLGVHITIDQETELFHRLLDVSGSGRGQVSTLLSALTDHGLPPVRLAAVGRAWEQITALAGLAQHRQEARARSPPRSANAPSPLPPSRAAGGVTIAVIRSVFDPAYHPDTRRKPIPLRTHAAVSARLVAGLAAVLREHSALGPVGESASIRLAIDRVLGAGQVPAGQDPVAEYGQALVEALDACPVSQEQWMSYCAYLSAGVASDDTFTRLLDGCWHIALKPHVTATAAALRGTDAHVRDTGMYKTAAMDVGSGLQFASKPYTPGGGKRVPVPPPSKLDLDAVVTQTGGPTHVTLLVTHADGSKSVQKLERDRFMDTSDTPALLARLESVCGLKDAVDACVDF